MFGIFRSRALAIEPDDLEEEKKPWPERTHNAELRAVVKDEEKLTAVEAADAKSKEVYDGIDEHVSELQRFRERLRRKRNGKADKPNGEK
jgi:hypothetical protein